MVLPELPQLVSQKVDRKALPPPAWSVASENGGAEYRLPSNELEQTVYNIWQIVLEVPGLSVTNDFFDVGGNSLLAGIVSSKIRAACFVELSGGLPLLPAQKGRLHRRCREADVSSLYQLVRQSPFLVGVFESRAWMT